MPPRRKIEDLLADCAKKPTFFAITDTLANKTQRYEDSAVPHAIVAHTEDLVNYLSASPGYAANTRWVLGNDQVEVYFEYTPAVYEEDPRPNRPAVYKIVQEAIATQGICIRRSRSIPEASKSHVELRLSGNASGYQLQFVLPAIAYKAHISPALKHEGSDTRLNAEDMAKMRSYIQSAYFKEDLEWFKCALGWLKDDLYLPAPAKAARGGRAANPTGLITFNAENLYYPTMPQSAALGRNSEYHFATTMKLTDFVVDVVDVTEKETKKQKSDLKKFLSAWAADVPSLLAKPAPKRPVAAARASASSSASANVRQGSPTSAAVKSRTPAAVRSPSHTDAVLMASPALPAYLSAASDTDRVLQGSPFPIITPAPKMSPVLPLPIPTESPVQKQKPKKEVKPKKAGLKITKKGVKKPLFEGEPIKASITGESVSCLHTTDTKCFIVETITTVKKDILAFDVAPPNATFYRLLEDIRHLNGKEKQVGLYVTPSISCIVVETVKNVPAVPGKTERSIFYIFQYDKRGKKYNYTLLDKTLHQVAHIQI